MKKYLLVASFLLTIPTVNASLPEKEGVELRPHVRAVEPTLDLPQVFNSFNANQQNFEVVGRVMGFGGSTVLKATAVTETLLPAVHQAHLTYTTQLRGYFERQMEEERARFAAELKKQQDQNAETLEAAKHALTNMSGVGKALTEAQEERDRLKQQLQTTQAEMTAAQGRATVLKKKEEQLLLESDKKDAAALLEATRKKLLEEENATLKRVIAELASTAEEEGRLLRENEDNTQALNIQTGSADQIEATKEQILAVIERNKQKIQTLQSTKAALESSKNETEAKVKKLEKAIEENDYYTQIYKMIKNRNVSDDDLALFIWSVKTIMGADLDQLSAARPKRLIVKLIDVSQPYGNRPLEYSAAYENSFRTLGNLFTPNGLAWVGESLDYDTCRHEGSQFAKKSADIAEYAKRQLSTSNK